MIDGTGIPSNRRVRLLVVVVGALLIMQAQTQAQVPSPPYPNPSQTYPSPAPSYPTPTYPNQTYPNPASPTPNPAYPNPAYPNPGAYPAPQSGYPAPIQGYPVNNQPNAAYPNSMPAPPKSHFFRDLFAQTLAVVLQTSTSGLLGAIGGRIMEWFAHKGNSSAGYNAGGYPNGGQYSQYPGSSYPNTGYPSTTPGYPGTPYPTSSYPTGTQTAGSYPGASQTYPSQPSAYPSPTSAYPAPTTAYPTGTQTAGAYPGTTQTYPPTASAYPGTAYPTQAAPGAQASYGATPYGTPAYGAAPTQVYDARTGQLVTGTANPYATRGVDMENAIYAGIAYEVDAIAADGQKTPVNTATYEFHTGDKFMVYYRPSLPGHMEIYNVNATGQQTLIDSSNMAAGQMLPLGPYQFTNQTGDETLRLVLSPCSSPQLLAATRDIVKMDSPPQTSPTGGAVKLGSCGAPTPRGVDVHTRDIQKVGVEGTTSFALDPISPQELSSGQVTPRQAIIVFHHR